MADKLSNKRRKDSKKNKSNESSDENQNTDQTILLDIKKELNTTLKDLFEDHDERLSKIESILFSKEDKDKEKTPEHLYN